MKSGSYIPKRGDIVWINFNPQAGHEQNGKRPALILSPKIYNEKASLCIALPITSKIKGYPFEVPLPHDMPISGVVLSDQVKSFDFRMREAKFICSVPKDIIKEVQKNIQAVLIDAI